MEPTTPPAAEPAPPPRRRTALFAILFAALALLTFPVPPLVLAPIGSGSLPHRIAQGGLMMYLLPPVHLLAVAIMVALGVLCIRGARIPGAAVLALVGLPVAAGVAGTVLGGTSLAEALPMVHPAYRATILVTGLSEASLSAGVGLVSAALLAFLAGTQAFLAHAAGGPSRQAGVAGDPATSGRASRLPLPALACGAAGLLGLGASVVSRLALGAPIGPVDLVAWAALLVAAAFAALAAPGLQALRRLPDHRQRSDAWRRGGLMAAGLGAAMALLGYAAWVFGHSDLWSSLSSAAPEARAALMASAAAALSHRPTLAIADTALCCAVLTLPLLFAGPAIEDGLKGLRLSFVASAVGALALVALAAAPARLFHQFLEQAAAPVQRLERQHGLQLPRARPGQDGLLGEGPLLFVFSRDRVLLDDSGGTRPPVPYRADSPTPAPGEPGFDGPLMVAADEKLAFEDLCAVLEPAVRAGARDLQFVVTTEERPGRGGGGAPPLPSALAELKLLISPGYATTRSFTFVPAVFPERPAREQDGGRSAGARGRAPAPVDDGLDPKGTLTAMLDGEEARLFLLEDGGGVLRIPLRPEASAHRREMLRGLRDFPTLQTLLIAPAPSDPVERVVAAMEAVRSSLPGPDDGVPDQFQVSLTGDRGAVEEVAGRLESGQTSPAAAKATPETTALSAQALVVGASPKEEIRAVVRRHLPQIRFCYERELARDPNLAGKVVASFAIDSKGSVQEATATGLPNAELLDCITARIRTWAFPPPRDGGVVRVSYPFVFRVAEDEPR